MFPRVLYKAFSRIEYAESFCDGKVRFSTLKYYKDIEDNSRADRTEGFGTVKRNGEKLIVDTKNQVIHSRPGRENLHVAAIEEDHFICCFSTADNDGYRNLPNKFGKFYVQINSPESLFRDIAAAIEADKGLQQNPPVLEVGAVRYDKGGYVGELTDREEMLRLAWLQKPASYSDECEYRFQFLFSIAEFIGSPDHYNINVGKKLDYTEIFTREP